MSYPWYETIDEDNNSLEQGDIVDECRIIVPGQEHYQNIMMCSTTEGIPTPVQTIHGILMSQSCDIANDKVDFVILCPLWSLSELEASQRNDLRKGRLYAYHLLEEFDTPTLPKDFYFVDFHHIHSIPKDFLRETVKGKKRKRLLPPYREHLSQSFARYFMRVGLPIGIAEEKIKNYGRDVS